MRTLHLICAPVVDEGVPGNGGACLGAMGACAAAVAGEGVHRVVLLGGVGAEAQGRLCGLRADRIIRPVLGMAELAWSAVRAERSWRADRVVLWSPGLSRLARIVGARESIQTAWAGGPVESGVEAGPAMPRAREDVRRAWGVPEDRGLAVGLLADPASEGDARQFGFLLGLVEVGVGPLIGVVSAGSAWLGRGRRFHRRTGRRSPLLVVRGSMLAWAGACDVVVLQGSRSGEPTPGAVHAARHALASGCVVVGPAWLGRVPGVTLGHRAFATDGRTRTLLPAMMRALRVAGPWLPIEDATGVEPASSDGADGQQSPA